MSKDVSIVIPTYNKKLYLQLTLASFAHQSYPAENYEIVVVDDGSTDGTEDIISTISLPCGVKYVRQDNKGRAAARNAGISVAGGEIILLVDDDGIVEPNFIEEHMRIHRETGHCIVSGYRRKTISFIPEWSNAAIAEFLNKEPELKEGLSHHIEVLETNERVIRVDDVLENFKKIREIKSERGLLPEMMKTLHALYPDDLEGFCLPWLLFVTSNVSLRKELLLDDGLFDESFKGWGLEDWELGYRLYKRGVSTYINLNAINYHQIHPSNRIRAIKEEARNYEIFCLKHPYFETYLNWKFRLLKIDICHYNNLVREFYNLKNASFETLQQDYLEFVKQQAMSYIRSALKLEVQ